MPNVPIFKKNVQANLANFIEDLFWGMSPSNEDCKTVDEVFGDHQDLNLSLPRSTRDAAQSGDARREAKRFLSASNSNELKEKDKIRYTCSRGLLSLTLPLSPDKPRPPYSVVGLEFSHKTVTMQAQITPPQYC